MNEHPYGMNSEGKKSVAIARSKGYYQQGNPPRWSNKGERE